MAGVCGNVNAGDAIRNVTVTVRLDGVRLACWRLRAATWLMRLASLVGGYGLRVIDEEDE